MSIRSRHLFPVLAIAICSGCVTAEGIHLGSDPYVNQGFVKYGRLPDAPPETDPDDSKSAVTGLIVVGTVSAFREIKPEDAEAEYRKYVRAFESWEADRHPNLGSEEFSRTIRGWTRIKVFGVPLLFAGYVKALVPVEITEDVDFEPVIATFLLQTSSDLVAARTNSDGAFVVETLLCEDRASYSECAQSYEKGVFDATTGLKLDGKLKVSESGPRIDPISFRIVVPQSRELESNTAETGE